MIFDLETEKQLAANEAVKLFEDHQIVGLGTGSTAKYAITAIGELVKNGLTIKVVATSVQTAEMAISLNIPLIDIESVDSIDITIDGTDEFTTDLALIKGGGGALLREKIVASLSKTTVIIADSSKKVAVLGKFKLPIAVLPMACNYVLLQIKNLYGSGVVRMVAGKPFITDDGNYIVDADFGLIDNPAALSVELNNIVGIVAHGLFINLASKIIMGKGGTTITFMPK